jgi:hypothetical protein
MKCLSTFFRWIFAPAEAAPPMRTDPSAVAANKVLEETLAHAKAGYQNAQEVIKFVDTKTAVVTGLSTVTAGFLLAVLKWSIEADGVSRPDLNQLTAGHSCTAVSFYIFVVLSFVCALACLAAAVWSVIARARPRNLENAFTILFPIYRRRDAVAAYSAFEQKLKGMNRPEIIKEYEDQLRIVGMILGQKLKHIRISCIALLAQIVCLGVAAGLLTCMYVTHPSKPIHCSTLAVR